MIAKNNVGFITHGNVVGKVYFRARITEITYGRLR